jgi:hypothetical protein
LFPKFGSLLFLMSDLGAGVIEVSGLPGLSLLPVPVRVTLSLVTGLG